MNFIIRRFHYQEVLFIKLKSHVLFWGVKMLRSCFNVILRSKGVRPTIHAHQSPSLMLRCLNARPYGSAAHLTREQIEERVLTVLRNFDRVNQSKVTSSHNR